MRSLGGAGGEPGLPALEDVDFELSRTGEEFEFFASGEGLRVVDGEEVVAGFATNLREKFFHFFADAGGDFGFGGGFLGEVGAVGGRGFVEFA